MVRVNRKDFNPKYALSSQASDMYRVFITNTLGKSSLEISNVHHDVQHGWWKYSTCEFYGKVMSPDTGRHMFIRYCHVEIIHIDKWQH